MFDVMFTQASTYAGQIDGLILLILVIVGFWFLLAELALFGLIFKFRAKPDTKSQYVTGKEKHLKRWITIPHALILLFDIVIVVVAVRVWNEVKIQMPETDRTVRVIGQQWAWVFQHPGADDQLDTQDDIFTTDSLHIENEMTYQYELESRDVLHDFSVPVFRLKQDAIPGRRIRGWFQPTQEGVFDIQCAEICGIGHGVMHGVLRVRSAGEHAAWVEENTPVTEDGTNVPETPLEPQVLEEPEPQDEITTTAATP